MNVLVLSPYIPYPPDSGAKIRTYNLIRYLAGKHQVHLLCFCKSKDELKCQTDLQNQGILVTTVPVKNFASKVSWFGHHIANFFSPIPWVVKLSTSSKMRQRLNQLIEANQFDVVLTEYLYMGQYAHNLQGVLTLLDEHNVESVIHKRLLRSRKFILKPYYFLEWLKLQSYEKRICQRFNKVLTVSKEDKQVLKGWVPDLGITVIPNGVDTKYFSLSNTRIEENSLIFTGLMNWPPNIDAVRWFTFEILPLIQKRLQGVVFSIVGQKPPRKVLELSARNSSVVVTGQVEDVRPFIAKAGVYVAPIRAGGGTRLKILEAMALGKPVVSTSLGCEGLKIHPGKDIYVADKPEVFAQKVVELLTDEERRKKMSLKARERIKETYEWKKCLSELEEVWN